MIKVLPILLLVASCGTAKTQYIDTKYDLCMQSCTIKYSKYQQQKLNSCKAKCAREKYDN